MAVSNVVPLRPLTLGTCWFPPDGADCCEPGCTEPKRADDPQGLMICAERHHRVTFGKRVSPLEAAVAYERKYGYARRHGKPHPPLELALVEAMVHEVREVSDICYRLLQCEHTKADCERLLLALRRIAIAPRLLDDARR
jgi:hypothetical protein